MSFIDELKYNSDGLIPAIIQDDKSGTVLMMAYMNAESLERSIDSGTTVFWSRSRKKFWRKGETSGHVQKIRSISVDCDADTLLIRVDQTGPACHEGYRSCFFRTFDGERLVTTGHRLVDPQTVYGGK
ncbi:MAG: phosphoribosyl-AMP cyclohydrolase [Verrucomicrobia bacterium]|nr:phosphoribosyl-AMP cyclohydrolase [Verrucomicrobiota bacterium]MCF7708850.1 phosphoribosyl-AMP cyclohydrolase [Verrucomicrobiota bacterium]